MPELKLWMEQELERLRKEVDDALQRLQAELPTLYIGPMTGAPIVFHDSGECLRLLMELPGISPEDIDITVSPEKIVISTKMERKETGPHALYGYTRRRLFREIPLPKEVDMEGISALYHDECLRIDIPWQHARIRRIAVESTEN